MNDSLGRLTNRLVEITEQKTQHLEKILLLTRKQSEVIDEGQFEELSIFLNEKQTNIDAINKLDTEFDAIFNAFADKPLNMAAALQPSILSVQKLADEISLIEQSNNEKAIRALDEVKAKLKDLRKGKNGYNAYKKSALSYDSRNVEKKS